MNLGVQLYGCSREFRQSPYFFFEKMKEAGFVQIEPCILFDDPVKLKENKETAFLAELLWLPEEVEGFVKQMQPLGLSLSSAHVFAASLAEVLPKMIETTQKNHIQAYVVNTPDWAMSAPDQFAEELTYAALELEKVGTELWLHNSGKDFANTVLQKDQVVPIYLYILRQAKNVYAQVDTGWVLYGGIDPATFLKENFDLVKGIHFKDLDFNFKAKQGNDIFAVLGDGCVDTAGIMKLISGRDNLPLVIDQDASKGDFIKDLERSAKFLGSFTHKG